MACKQFRDTVDNPRSIDSALVSQAISVAGRYLRLALEVLHDVEEAIIYIRLVVKLDLDLVQIRQGILSTMVSSFP